MLEREDRKDSHWRQPWTSDSLALGSEMTTGNHPIGRATSVQGRVVFTAGLSKPALYTVSVVRVFSLPQGNQRSFLDSSPGLSGLYLASSATTWVNLPNVGGQPTRMY